MNFAVPTTARVEAPRPSHRRTGSHLVGLFVAVANVILYWPAAFGGWNFYDDEGAMLITLRSFAERGGLYTDTYANYGPFPFALWWCVLRPFGFAYDNLFVGRLLALALLVVASWLTYDGLRVRAGVVWSAIVAFAVAATLTLNFSEPFHPGALIGAMLALAFWAQTRITNPKIRLAIEGGVCAALFFTKINLGVFAMVAWLCASLLRDPKWSRGLRRKAVILASAVFPLAVVVPASNDLPTILLALSVATTVGLVGFAAAHLEHHAKTIQFIRTLPMFALGGAVASVFALGVPVARGSTVTGILEAMLGRAIQQRGVFSAAPRFDSPRLAAFLVIVAITGFFVARNRVPSTSTNLRSDHRLLGIVKTVGGLAFIVAPSFRVAILPLLALCFVNPDPRSEQQTPASPASPMLFGVLFSVLQVLHAYPVARSQMAWATMLLPVYGAFLLVRGIEALAARPALTPTNRVESSSQGHGRWHTAITGVAFVLVVGRPVATIPSAWAGYRSLTPLGAHAEFVRVEKEQARTLRRVSSTLEKNCSAFYSLPGMYSFNALSGLPIATGYNATVWPSLFTNMDQQRVIRELNSHKGLCIVRNDAVMSFWTKEPLPKSALLDYVDTFDKELAMIDGYSISVRSPTAADQK